MTRPHLHLVKVYQEPQIKLIGVGGAGGQAVCQIIDSGVHGVECICVDTDAVELASFRAHKKIQLGSSGLGAGGNPALGRKAAAESCDEIRAAIIGADLLFIIAGMGGGTGTGAAPMVARLAKEMGIQTVGWVTLPFDFEGNARLIHARVGLRELQAQVDTLLVTPCDTLLAMLDEETFKDEAFVYANVQLNHALVGMLSVVNVPNMVNIDFHDVRTLICEAGVAVMSTAVASGPDRDRLAADQALAFLLYDGSDIGAAKCVLVVIAASKGNLKLSEAKLVMNTIRTHTSLDAHFIYGTTYDDSLNDEIRVTVVITGINFEV